MVGRGKALGHALLDPGKALRDSPIQTVVRELDVLALFNEVIADLVEPLVDIVEPLADRDGQRVELLLYADDSFQALVLYHHAPPQPVSYTHLTLPTSDLV